MVGPSGAPLTSQLAAFLHEQRQRWTTKVETLQHRIVEIQAELPALQERAALPAASDEDKIAVRTAAAGIGLARRQLTDLRDGYWIGVLEEHGILPNYTLVDDSVALDVSLSWIDPDTQTFESSEQTFNRGAALALRDLAPGATFYANGHQVVVDAVELGPNGQDVHLYAFCPACGHSQQRTASPPQQHAHGAAQRGSPTSTRPSRSSR